MDSILKNYFIQTAHIQGKFFIELHNHSILIKVWILLQFLIKFLSDLINCCPRKFYPRARRAGSSIFLTNKITLDSSNQIILFLLTTIKRISIFQKLDWVPDGAFWSTTKSFGFLRVAQQG